ncbi:MAG: PEGA domain-containing protein [Gammaproteobacteria bacterium]
MKFNIFGHQHKILIVGLLLLSLLVLQGCGSGRKGITIDSEPQGAEILADGRNIGKTPLQIKQDDVFPPHWYGRSYMVKGQLEIKKEGCEDVRMEVNDLVLSKDIKKNLSCKPGVTPLAPVADVPVKKEAVKQKATTQTVVPAAVPATVDSKPAPKSSKSNTEIENRLAKLKDLRDRGVISAKEYSEQRKRILDSL